MRSSPFARGPGDYAIDELADDEDRECEHDRRDARDRAIEDDVACGLYDCED